MLDQPVPPLSSSTKRLILWRLLDGKPGHEKQTLGLSAALARQIPCAIHDIPAPPGGRALIAELTGRFPPGDGLPDPDLILGAGHRTHWALLAARRARGGKTIVCMKPGLPLACFDLCLIPRHDRPPQRANVIETWGALTNITPGGSHAEERGILLIGGPSPHFGWDNAAIAGQIRDLLAQTPEIRWTLTTSRRTPATFLAEIGNLPLDIRPVETTPPGWVETQLAASSLAWATPDSVSMVYEALTAGCRTGTFHLAAKPGSRVATGIAELIRAGRVSASPAQHPAPQPFDESARCAKAILQRWAL